MHTVQKWITTLTTNSFHSKRWQAEQKKMFLCREQFSNDETGSMTLEMDEFAECARKSDVSQDLAHHNA